MPAPVALISVPAKPRSATLLDRSHHAGVVVVKADETGDSLARAGGRLVIWTLLDTGLRVSERAGLRKDNVDWQTHRLIIYGKGGPHGTQSKRRIVPLTARVQPLIEGHLGLHDEFGMSDRTIQRLITRVANRAAISRRVGWRIDLGVERGVQRKLARFCADLDAAG